MFRRVLIMDPPRCARDLGPQHLRAAAVILVPPTNEFMAFSIALSRR